MGFLLSAFLLLSSSFLCEAQNVTGNGNTTFNGLGFPEQDYNLTTVDIQYQVWSGCGPSDNLTTVNRRVSYVVFNGLAIVDGDVVYGTEEDILQDIVHPNYARGELPGSKRALSIRTPNARWPNARIPWAFNSDDCTNTLSASQATARKDLFRKATQVWMEKLPWLDIVEVTGPFDDTAKPAVGIRVTLIDGSVSWSPVGRASSQAASEIAIGADSLNVYVHELGHSLGLRHEHQRPDRDQYFNLDCSKLAPAPPSNTPAKCGVPCEGWGCQFAAIDNPEIFNFEGPYDTSSIMHYEEYLFATDWTQPALTGVVPGVRVTAGERPSLMDAVRVCEMYGDLCKGICGDGILAPGNQEECDPGCEGVDTATCTAGCKLTQAVCGNNIVEPGEACDDGPSGSATCSATCQLLPVCGNNVVEMDEECDDGPAGSATCSPTCRTISCIATCDPDPNYNGCDITTSCIAVEGGSAASQGKHYCACRHGFKAPEGVDQMRLPWYSPISQEGRVFVPPGQACNVLCDDWTLGRDGCKGVDERPMCY